MVEVSPDIASKRQSVPPPAQWKDNNSPYNIIIAHINIFSDNHTQVNNSPQQILKIIILKKAICPFSCSMER